MKLKNMHKCLLFTFFNFLLLASQVASWHINDDLTCLLPGDRIFTSVKSCLVWYCYCWWCNKNLYGWV